MFIRYEFKCTEQAETAQTLRPKPLAKPAKYAYLMQRISLTSPYFGVSYNDGGVVCDMRYRKI